METEYTPAKRGRPSNAEIAARESRAETTRRERRRRADTGETRDLKLHVPDHLKKDGYTYRWVNDTAGGRVAALEAEDWDVVKNAAIEGEKEGLPVKRIVGTNESGQPLYSYLMEKPEEWHKEDRNRNETPRKEQEQAMLRGPSASAGLSPNEAYVPSGHVNRIVQE